jgi:hypothetical protein
MLDGILSRILSYRRLPPLCGLMASRYHRGYAVTTAPVGWDLHPHGFPSCQGLLPANLLEQLLILVKRITLAKSSCGKLGHGFGAEQSIWLNPTTSRMRADSIAR